MCGIYGMAKSPNKLSRAQLIQAQKIMRSLAISSEARGHHSSGLAEISKTESLVHKSLSPSSKFVQTKTWSKSLKRLNNTSIYLGHTRFATMGSISLDNAHPFSINKTIGVHNGCFYNVSALEKEVGKACEVDTQYLFELIDREDKIQDAVKHLNGDFAIAFVKGCSQTLYLTREKNRPCFVGYWKEARILFFASQKDFLEKAFDSVKIQVEITSLQTNRLYEYDTRKFDNQSTNVGKMDYEYESRSLSFVNTSYHYLDEEDYLPDVDFDRYSTYDIPDDGYLTYDEALAFMQDTEVDADSGESYISELVYPIETRDDSKYWTLSNGRWFFWDPRDNTITAERELSANQWCLIDRLREHELQEDDYGYPNYPYQYDDDDFDTVDVKQSTFDFLKGEKYAS